MWKVVVIGKMEKIRVLHQVLDPSGAGGVSSEFRALKNSTLTEKYDFDSMILMDIHPGISLKDIYFYYREILKKHPDIVHIRGAAVDGLNAVIAAKIARKGKILVTVHGMYSDLIFISPLKKWISKNIIERAIFMFADGISCVCQTAERRTYFDRYRNKMLPFVYNRIPDYDRSKHLSYRNEIRKRYEIQLNAIVALYVGRMTKEKGLQYMLESLRILAKNWPDDLVVLFVGDGDFRKQMEMECKKLKTKILFVGNQIEVEKYYASADFFVQPSLHENHSVSLLESVAAALPAIATYCGGNSEIVDANVTGLIVPVGDSCALTNAIIQMCKNEVRDKFKQNIITADYSRFSSHSSDKALGEVYKKLLERNNVK